MLFAKLQGQRQLNRTPGHSMDHEFWHQRWQTDEIGFHEGRVNRHLQKHWAKVAQGQAGTVLVPLCGKAEDLAWLREQGHRVIGVELSALACRAFFEEHGLQPDVRHDGAFQRFSHSGIDLLCGDFFKLTSAHLGDTSLLYDRAAMIALPPDVRPGYCSQLASLLPAGARGLLISLDYPEQDFSGPPFAVSQAEIERNLSASFRLTRLAQGPLPADNPLPQRGLKQGTECIFQLQRT